MPLVHSTLCLAKPPSSFPIRSFAAVSFPFFISSFVNVFVANGFDRGKVQKHMEGSKRGDDKDQAKEQKCRGMVAVPYVRLSEQFKRLATKHSFRTAFKPGVKIKELKREPKSHLVINKSRRCTELPVNARMEYMSGKPRYCLKLERKNMKAK